MGRKLKTSKDFNFMKKTYEETLWNWLIKNFPEKVDARRIFDYVIRLNKKPRLIKWYTPQR